MPPFIKVVRQTSLGQGTIGQTHTCHSKVLKLFKKKDHRLFDPNFWLLLLGKPTSDEPWMWQDVPPPNIISHFQLKQQPGPVTCFEQFWSSREPVCVFAWAEFREALLVKLFAQPDPQFSRENSKMKAVSMEPINHAYLKSFLKVGWVTLFSSTAILVRNGTLTK